MSKLSDALEQGKSPIGLTGYVETDLKDSEQDSILMKSKIARVDASKECGVSIYAKPVSGQGEFKLSPCQWYDDVKTFKKKREREKRVEEANSVFLNIMRNRLKTVIQKEAVKFILTEYPGEEQTLREEVGVTDKTATSRILAGRGKSEIKDILSHYVAKKFGIDPDELSSVGSRWY